MALSFPTKQTPPQANRSATYSLIAHSKVALATITTFQHAVVRTQNAGPAFSNGPQRHTECYTYPDTNGIMSACGYLKKKCKNPEHRPMKAGAVGENITCLFHFSSLTSSRQSVPLHARRGHFISPCEFVRKHLAGWSWNPDLCGRVRTSLPPPLQRWEHNEPNEHWRETGALQMSSLWTLILASVYFVIHFNQTLLPHPRT